ncbi:hypothetical protein NQ117_05155 [Paenibacillus sp. SC116]|nr:hypothetical protein [Paenibacillus sp. SC116]
MADLQADTQVNFAHIYKCYVINDLDILDRSFTEFEKSMHAEYKQSHQSSSLDSEWERIQSGQLIRVILESNYTDTLSSFTVQGMCMNIVQDLTILKGVSSADVHADNPYFNQYLQILQARGYL